MGKRDCKKEFTQLTVPLEECDWKLSYEIGKGEDATVYLACCDDICNYVIKVIQGRTSNFFTKVANEITIHEKFSKLGLAPRLIDAYICNKEASLVMERKDMSIEQYVNLLLRHNVSSTMIETLLDEIEEAVIQLIRRAHKAKLVHNDIHLNNIMIDVSDELEWSHPQFIDFGKSYEVESKEKADKAETEHDFILSLNMLRKLAKRGYVNTYEAPRAPKKEMPASPASLASPVSSKGSVVRGNLFDEEEEDTVSANLYDAFEEEIISTPKKVARRLEL